MRQQRRRAPAARQPDPERGRDLEALAVRMQCARRRVRAWRQVVIRRQHDWERVAAGAPDELRALVCVCEAQTAYVEALQEQRRARAAWHHLFRRSPDDGSVPDGEARGALRRW
jgi:hypothetical protein